LFGGRNYLRDVLVLRPCVVISGTKLLLVMGKEGVSRQPPFVVFNKIAKLLIGFTQPHSFLVLIDFAQQLQLQVDCCLKGVQNWGGGCELKMNTREVGCSSYLIIQQLFIQKGFLFLNFIQYVFRYIAESLQMNINRMKRKYRDRALSKEY